MAARAKTKISGEAICSRHLRALSNPTKMRISPIKLQGRVVVPRMVATSEKNVQLAFLNYQAKQLKSIV